MNVKQFACILAAVTLLATSQVVSAADMKDSASPESVVADMAFIEEDMKTSTERPPVAAMAAMESEPTEVKPEEEMKKTETVAVQPPNSIRHTVGDFIIHPLIAFKPRNPEVVEYPAEAGKQASGTSTTTPSPWTLFGFNAGNGLGSSVSSLAGQVSGWINDRIQLPGFVDTPVREPSTTTTTTTTPRPDVVVRVQHRTTTQKPPLISINNQGNGPRYRPNNNNNNFDSEEDDDDYDDFNYNRRGNKNGNNNNNNNNFDDEEYEEDEEEEVDNKPNRVSHRDEHDDNDHDHDENEGEEEYDHSDEEHDEHDDHEEDEDEPVKKQPNRRGRPMQNQGNRQRRPQGSRRQQQNRRRNQNSNGSHRQHGSDAVVYDDEPEHDDHDADSVEVHYDDDEVDESADEPVNDRFYYAPSSNSKRSQSSSNFIQRGQQSIIDQIRQLTRGQGPSDIANIYQAAPSKRRQATLMVNRNGQTVYVAPELTANTLPLINSGYFYAQPAAAAATVNRPAVATSAYPQPPLMVPLKRKGRPTQYITIPWAQLGISPPDQLVSVAEGIQTQPLILNIPQSAINNMQKPTKNKKKKKRPAITSDAVPLLAEASLMDIFRPPRIPPSRSSTGSSTATTIKNGTPVFISTKSRPNSVKTTTAVLPQRVRSGTVVEMSPAVNENVEQPSSMAAGAGAIQDATVAAAATAAAAAPLKKNDDEFILVGDDNEPGMTRQVQPVFGDARYVHISDSQPLIEFLNRRHFAIRKGGRALEDPENVELVKTVTDGTVEQHIPVQIIVDGDSEPKMAEEEMKMIQSEMPKMEMPTEMKIEMVKSEMPESLEAPVMMTEKKMDGESMMVVEQPAAPVAAAAAA